MIRHYPEEDIFSQTLTKKMCGVLEGTRILLSIEIKYLFHKMLFGDLS